jgi:hypothetical protein
MSSINSISADKLTRLVGTPKSPAIIDVRTDEDLAGDPPLIPSAVRRPHDNVSTWASALTNSAAVVVLGLSRATQTVRPSVRPSTRSETDGDIAAARIDGKGTRYA